MEEDGSRHCSLQMTGDDGKKPERSTGRGVVGRGQRTVVRIHTAEKTEEVNEFGYLLLVSIIKTDTKCHMEIKRRVLIGEETFSKRKELLRGKLDRNLKKRMIKTNAMEIMECHAVWITDLSYDKRRYKKTGGLRNVNMKKNRKNQLD